MNSVGVLPLPYFASSIAARAAAAIANAAQIAAQYVRSVELRQAHALWFRPYAPLPDAAAVDAALAGARALLGADRAAEAATAAREVADTVLAGLRHVRTYDRLFLMAVDVAAYLGWMAAIFAVLAGAPRPRLSSAVRSVWMGPEPVC
jgi:phosphatidylinositol glycan class N